MRKAITSCALLGIGAGLMYLFDPNLGRRRRAILHDKASSAARKLESAADIVQRDFQNRLEGIKHGDIALSKMDILQARWAPATRFLVGTGSSLMLFFGRGRTLRGRFFDMLLMGALAEALTNASLRGKRAQAGQRRQWSGSATTGAAGQQGSQEETGQQREFSRSNQAADDDQSALAQNNNLPETPAEFDIPQQFGQPGRIQNQNEKQDVEQLSKLSAADMAL